MGLVASTCRLASPTSSLYQGQLRYHDGSYNNSGVHICKNSFIRIVCFATSDDLLYRYQGLSASKLKPKSYEKLALT
jgi:hypothetical protein